MGARSRKKLMGDLPLAYLEAADSRHRAGGSYFDAARERAAALGYKLERIDLDTWESVHRIWDVLYAQGYGGILIAGVRSDNHPLLLSNKRFPVVCCGRVDALPFHTVRPAILPAMKKAFEEITRKGYRKIGAAVLRHDPPVEDDFIRLSAALGCLHELGPEHARIPPLCHCALEGGETVKKWIHQYHPDVVLAFHDGIQTDILDAGFRIPEDIAFASLHRDPRAFNAGLDQNFNIIANAAVNLLDQLIRSGELGIPKNPLSITVESTWYDGPTLPQKGA